jgi:hypothetical protein
MNLEDDVVGGAPCRRVVRVMLAIEAFRLQHGRMPKTLDELVGPYFKELPHNPYTGEPFRYVPEGSSVRLFWPDTPHEESPRVLIEAGRPFLWSAGTRVRVVSPEVSDFTRYRIMEGRGWERPRSEQDVWQAGAIFALPVPQQKVPAGGSPAPHK